MKKEGMLLVIFLVLLTAVYVIADCSNPNCETPDDCAQCPEQCNNHLVKCCNNAQCQKGHNALCINYKCFILLECGDDNCDERFEDCKNCSADCLDQGQVCCDAIAHDGDCCTDEDCNGVNCLNYICNYPEENCSDEIQNQNESDVDCGGPCDPCPINSTCIEHSDCITDYCSEGVCAEEILTNCTENDTRECEIEGWCRGNRTCIDGKWGDCISDYVLCDADCDGETDDCMLTCAPCTCTHDENCTSRPCSIATCEGEPKKCVYTTITECADEDGCCVPGCTWVNDNDCPFVEECHDNSDCIDDNLCTKDICEGIPRKCEHYPIENCFSGDGCCLNNCTFATDMDCSCTPEWACDEWWPPECPREKRQQRNCTDLNQCTDRIKKETKLCKYAGSGYSILGDRERGMTMLTRDRSSNTTNVTAEGEGIDELKGKVNKGVAIIIILIILTGVGMLYFLYHEGFFDKFKSRETKEMRKKKMFQRIKFFREHGQSDVMIKTNLIAEKFSMQEINEAFGEYNLRYGKK